MSSSHVTVNVNVAPPPLPPAATQRERTFCWMPQVQGVAICLCLIFCLESIGFGVVMHMVTEANSRTRSEQSKLDPTMLCFPFVVDMIVDLMAIGSVCTKRLRFLLLPWILINVLYAICYFITLVGIPLGILWYFLIRNVINLFQTDFGKKTIVVAQSSTCPIVCPNAGPESNNNNKCPLQQQPGMPMNPVATQSFHTFPSTMPHSAMSPPPAYDSHAHLDGKQF